jgi:hypothetical protein
VVYLDASLCVAQRYFTRRIDHTLPRIFPTSQSVGQQPTYLCKEQRGVGFRRGGGGQYFYCTRLDRGPNPVT